MTVAELIGELEKMRPDLLVYVGWPRREADLVRTVKLGNFGPEVVEVAS